MRDKHLVFECMMLHLGNGSRCDMTIEIRLPQMDQESADVLEVLVNVGDNVALEQSLLVLESSKATFDVPADNAGTVTDIQVKVGQTLSVGDLLMTLEEAEEQSESEPSPKTEDEAEVQPSAPEASEDDSESSAAPQPEKKVRPAATSKPVDGQANKPHAGPAVRYLAREFGVDLSLVKGSGRAGRILKDDVSQYVRQRLAEPQQGGVGGLAMPDVDHAAFGPISEQPLNAIKKATVEAMTLNTLVPQVTHFDEVNLGDKLPSQMVAKLCVAVARTLVEQPLLGASLGADQATVILKQYINIGVAMDTPAGLLVPVITDADKLSVDETQEQIVELQEKAMKRRLKVAEMTGATFTISSLGKLGGTGFTALVVPPQVGILSVACSQKRLELNEKGQPEYQFVLPLGLSYDHRVVDGAEAGRFMQTLLSHLQDILRA